MTKLPGGERGQGMLCMVSLVALRCIGLPQRVQRGTLTFLLCPLAFILFATSSPQASAQKWDACSPSPEVNEALDAIPKQALNQTDWEFHQKEIQAIQNVRKQHPDDIFAERRYIELMLNRTGHRKIIAEYKNKFAATPNSPLGAYLYGFALFSRDSVPLLSGALESDPKFPWPHLQLAWIYSLSPLLHDQSKVDAHIKAFLEECPESFDGYKELSGSGGDKELIRKSAAQLRAQLMKRKDADAIAAYPTLWGLEFKATVPSEYERLRKQAAQDVLRIRALNLQGTREWYDALEDGYKLSNDQQNSDWAKNEREIRFSNPQFPASLEKWSEDHHPPNKDDSAEIRRAYNKQLLMETDVWIQERPNSSYAWRTRLQAMTQLSEVPPTEIESAADRFIQLAEKNAGPEGAPSGDYFMAAQSLSREHLEPDRVSEMARKGLESLEIDRQEQESLTLLDTEAAAEHNFYQTSQYLDGLACLADAYIELRQPKEAQIALSRMDERLQQLKTFAADKGDRKEAYLNHASAYWDRMARLAELQQRNIDAMGFYENALLARLDAKQKPVPGEKDELAENAKELWSRMGGTSEGWTMWYGRRANELAQSVVLRWEDANEPLAPFELVDLNGKTWSSESLRGKVTFLNFWASW